jgi:nucleotide-binding universal stress UspA family protein
MTERRPFEDILVPLDGSPAAERALVPALELVSRTGVPLRLVSRALYDEKEQLAEYLAGISDRYAAVTDVETEVVDVESIPEAITDGMEPGTLVCMTSHGRGRTEALVGSITEAVLRTLRQPMLVVGPQIPEDSPLGGGWIVACLDGSDLAERCLEPAGTWSRSLGLPLWFVQVVPPRPPGERRRDEGVAGPRTSPPWRTGREGSRGGRSSTTKTRLTASPASPPPLPWRCS